MVNSELLSNSNNNKKHWTTNWQPGTRFTQLLDLVSLLAINIACDLVFSLQAIKTTAQNTTLTKFACATRAVERAFIAVIWNSMLSFFLQLVLILLFYTVKQLRFLCFISYENSFLGQQVLCSIKLSAKTCNQSYETMAVILTNVLKVRGCAWMAYLWVIKNTKIIG